MSISRTLLRSSLFLGIVAAILAWIVIGVSWRLNPWFVFTRDAFSDLGGPHACCPWIYNYGLILVGVLVSAWSIPLYYFAKTKLEAIGAGYMLLAGIFLALIGVFPSGTRPHVFISTWFFVQADLAFIALSAGMTRRKTPVGRILLAISLLAFPVAAAIEATIGWPSTATIEAYGIAVIDVGVILATLEYYKTSQ